VVAVDGGGDAADESDFALPLERPAAVGADEPCPGSVVDLAERGEVCAGVAVHGEDGAEVFGDDDSEVADLAEEAAARLLAVSFFGVPESSDASVRVPADRVNGSPERLLRISDLPPPGGPTRRSQTGSPSRLLAATAPRVARRLSASSMWSQRRKVATVSSIAVT
jgi:hypothetical protein